MRQLFSLYGPFAIQSFGLFIVLGILIFTFLFLRDPRRKKLISSEQYYNLLSCAILAGFCGARLLFVLTNWETIPSWLSVFAFWEGGYSLLGGILALLLVIPWYLKKYHLPALALIDLACVYAPLLQAISRIGCFFAGCCYGVPISWPWGIQSCMGSTLHPTQLYSAGILFLIFLFLYMLGHHLFMQPGHLACAYLFSMSAERFFVDFRRGDREFINNQFFSIAQLAALFLMALSICGFIYFTFLGKTHKKS